MNPYKFFGLNLRNGEKVKLVVQLTPTSKTNEVVLYFKGYRSIGNKRVVTTINDVVPVFYSTTNRGMRSQKEYGTVYFEEIVRCERFPGDFPVFSIEDTDAMYYNNSTREGNAICNIGAIVREMNALFPGKRIPLHQEGACAYVADDATERVSNPCYIHAVGLDDKGRVSYTVSDGNTWENIRMNSKFHPYSFLGLLGDLMGAILNPPSTDEIVKAPDEDVLCLDELPYDAIPETNSAEHPVLKKTGLLEELKYSKWWNSLGAMVKIELLGPDKYDEKWQSSPVSVKKNVFDNWRNA